MDKEAPAPLIDLILSVNSNKAKTQFIQENFRRGLSLKKKPDADIVTDKKKLLLDIRKKERPVTPPPPEPKKSRISAES